MARGKREQKKRFQLVAVALVSISGLARKRRSLYYFVAIVYALALIKTGRALVSRASIVVAAAAALAGDRRPDDGKFQYNDMTAFKSARPLDRRTDHSESLILFLRTRGGFVHYALMSSSVNFLSQLC